MKAAATGPRISITGLDDPLEAHVVDARKKRELAAILLERKNRDGSGLGHPFDHQDPRHDRPSREMSREIPLVGAHSLARDNSDVPNAKAQKILLEQHSRYSC